MPTILPLDSPDATLTNAGGKAQNLAKLARAGLPVPPGFVVTTAAYQAFVVSNGLQDFILSTLAATDTNNPVTLEAASAAIRARFSGVSVDSDLADPLVAAYHTLAETSGLRLTPYGLRLTPYGLPVAVRSSATAEDLPDFSFAGQQDTFLNVVGDQALLDAVVRCWSSLWTARAIAYRARNSIPQDGVALAVVVQAMVESEASGVLFTANPLTGKRSEVVIDATLGLGEALVSGQVEPDHLVVDVDAGLIVSKTLGAKALAIHSQASGGTATVRLDAVGRQALPDAASLELAHLGKRVERELYAGQPQDVEWAWTEDRLFLLQSRAITSLYPLPAGMPPEPLQFLFSVNHVQGMLDPFTPLGADALIRALVALARLFDREFTPQSQREVVVAGERLYANITPALRHALGRKLARGIFGAVEPGVGQALAGLWDEPAFAPLGRGFSPAALRTLAGLWAAIGPRLVAVLRAPDARREDLQQQIDAFVREMAGRARQTSSLAERLALWQSIYAEFASRISLPLGPAMIVGLGSFFQLKRLVQAALGSDQLALEAARGLPHNVTTEMDLALWTVAQVVRADPDSARRFNAVTAAELAAEFTAGRLPLPAQAALLAFMDRYGMRGLAEIDLGRPRWREEPEHIVQVVQSYLRLDDPELAPDVAFRRGAAAAQQAIDRLTQAMPTRAQARQARFLASRVRSLAGLRETPKFTVIRLMGIVRQMLLASGEELAAAGVFTRPDDIFFLHFEELEVLGNDERGMMNEVPERSGVEDEWRRIVAERRQAYERELRRRQVPRVLLSDGTAYYEGLGVRTHGEGVLTGSPVSPGVIEGVVHVVFDPREVQLAPGEILVCPGTDPSWTPLFLAAGGLVMEVGGLMTHGSVVAREYGIPAVVGVHEATQRLRSGQRIRVDGTAGRVQVVESRE